MFRKIEKFSHSTKETYAQRHRFEHWYVDNQVYFITARCRDRFLAFASEEAKRVFWDRYYYYCKQYNIFPWVTSLLDNHYHSLAYVRYGEDLKRFMQRLHGSVAKLVNDLLPERRPDFWRDERGKEYFDGCIRDVKQCRRAFRYTLTQIERHRILPDYTLYSHTRVDIPLEVGLERAIALEAFLRNVAYKRYEH